MFQISDPLFFLLLALLPILLIIHRYTRVEAAPWRKMATLVLRIGAMTCLVLAMVDLQWKDQEDTLSVVFLLDVSDSVPFSQQIEGIEQINAAVDALKPTDEFSLVVFGARASVRLSMRSKTEHSRLTPDILSDTEIDREATNLAGAIQLAMSLPTGTQARQKRLVLLSDGVQNIGEATVLLDLVRASGIEIFTIPLTSEREYEVWVSDLQLPSQVRSDQIFNVRAIIEATADTQIAAKLYRKDNPVSNPRFLDLKRGKQTVDFQQQISEESSYEYRLEIAVDDSDADNPENNTGYGFVRVSGSPRALYVEGDAEHATPLQTVLEDNRLTVETVSPADFPNNLVALQNSDVIILSNVSADNLSASQMELIESYVRDLGKGLLVIGGNRAFGRGGYHDTPLERVSPLDMIPRQRKESLALMLVIDTSGSMANYVGADQKIRLAIEGVRAAIRALDDEDRVGLIGFTAKIEPDLPPTTDHESILHEVGELFPGSGTKMYPALKKAYERLKAVEAKQKHIVLLSDGKSNGDFIPLAEQIAKDKITVTTIAIGDADPEKMAAIANAGGGRYTYVRNANQLPKILADEVRQTQKYTVQEAFQPIISERGGPILAGIDRVPKLYGYIATSEKELAHVYIRSHEEHPILAAWNYGLGRSVAFTSDVKPGWGQEWLEWEDYGKFWGQVVSWVLPEAGEAADFDLKVAHRNGKGEVIVDTESISRTSAPTFDLRVARPNAEGAKIELRRITPTRYLGEFPVREHGVYLVTAQKRRGGKIESSARESLLVSYPAEFAEFESDRRLLTEIANQTNGMFEPSPKQIAYSSGKGLEYLKPLSFALLTASVLLFALEMILRRFSIASGYLTDLKVQFGTLRRREEDTSPPTLARLSQKKATLVQRTAATFRDFDISLVTQSGYQRQTQAGLISAGHAPAESVSPIESSTGRLLEVKRRAQETRK